MATSALLHPHPRPRPQPFRIVIIGGAIGGLISALFLHHECTSRASCPPITIDVYEKASQYREIGNGIGIGANAARILDRIPGLLNACMAIAGKCTNGIWFTFARADTGETVTVLHAPRGARTQSSEGHAKPKPVAQPFVARSEFLRVLLRFIAHRGAANLHTNKRCCGIQDCGDSVSVTFTDGTEIEADLLIGSDGIHSTVRGHFVPRDTQHTRYSGKIAYRGIVPVNQLPTPWPFASLSAIWFAHGRHFLIYPISQSKSLNVVAFVTKSEEELPAALQHESWSTTCDSRADLERDFAGFEPVVQHIIARMPERLSVWRINDRDALERWYWAGGKVVLTGDAAHAMVPHQGAGAGQAVEDGYVLGKAVADYLCAGSKSGLGDWMELYQRVRLPRAQRVQSTSRQAGQLYQLQLPVFEDKTYDESCPILADTLRDMMNWIWTGILDEEYELARRAMMAEPAAA